MKITLKGIWSIVLIVCFISSVIYALKGDLENVKYFTILVMLINIRISLEEKNE